MEQEDEEEEEEGKLFTIHITNSIVLVLLLEIINQGGEVGV